MVLYQGPEKYFHPVFCIGLLGCHLPFAPVGNLISLPPVEMQLLGNFISLLRPRSSIASVAFFTIIRPNNKWLKRGNDNGPI